MASISRIKAAALVAAAVFAASVAVGRADSVPKAKTPLPGVDTAAGNDVTGLDRSAAADGPEQSPRGPGWVRVGDWDMKMSGSVTVDIATGRRLPDNDR